MRKVLAVGGLPATGKSSLIRRFMAEYGYGTEWIKVEPTKLVVGMKKNNLTLIGDYSDNNEKYPGTDRLSMAVQPNAIKFMTETYDNILFEGDRLFTASFLEEAASLADNGILELKIFLLTANPEVVAQRHTDRADEQSEQFLKGRATKYDNICSSLVLMPFIETFKNNTLPDRERVVKRLLNELT